MKYVIAFLRFWYDFIVGDDWRVAVGILVAIGLTAALAAGDVSAWWVMPLAVVATLWGSLRRATRHG
jgi:hydrogenase/urease accessory protein HupE